MLNNEFTKKYSSPFLNYITIFENKYNRLKQYYEVSNVYWYLLLYVFNLAYNANNKRILNFHLQLFSIRIFQ